jgi:phosphate:Na+ symporter
VTSKWLGSSWQKKRALRDAELIAAENHLARLREGRPESIETSSLHIDVLRELKRIHSHICSVAYPVLEAAGELEPNRLKRTDDVLALPNASSAAESDRGVSPSMRGSRS